MLARGMLGNRTAEGLDRSRILTPPKSLSDCCASVEWTVWHSAQPVRLLSHGLGDSVAD